MRFFLFLFFFPTLIFGSVPNSVPTLIFGSKVSEFAQEKCLQMNADAMHMRKTLGENSTEFWYLCGRVDSYLDIMYFDSLSKAPQGHDDTNAVNFFNPKCE